MRRRIGMLAAATAGLVAVLAAPAQALGHDDPLAGKARFYVEPTTNAGRQADIWTAAGRDADAAHMRALSKVSQAIWFTGGTPAEVRTAVRRTMAGAARQHAVPTLVAYYVPGRDCSQYSAGGAPSGPPTAPGSTPSPRGSAAAGPW